MPAIARQFINTGNGLNQSINANFNYSHSASDDVNIFPRSAANSRPTATRLAVGYSIGKGKLTNNFTFTWNRNNSQLRNFFTNTKDVSTQVGILGPNGTPLNSDPLNYGLPELRLQPVHRLQPDSSPTSASPRPLRWASRAPGVTASTMFASAETSPRPAQPDRRHQLHRNVLLHRLRHSGARNTVPATRSPTSGSSFADFLLGIPQETTIQSPQQKAYMRQNTWDLFAQDDWRALPSLTILAGLRYEYFSPYSETNDRLATLDYNSGFTEVGPVYPNRHRPHLRRSKYPRTLIYPERNNFSPSLGIAWRPFKDTVVRAGYGINYTVGQYGNFIQDLAYQPPFANVQNNRRSSGSGTVPGACGTPPRSADALRAQARLQLRRQPQLSASLRPGLEPRHPAHPAAGHRPECRL
jgi:outer membrane receptor protein involved in Fe transport